jgi:hypothetical protein
MEAVRALLRRFEAKIQRVLDCVWEWQGCLRNHATGKNCTKLTSVESTDSLRFYTCKHKDSKLSMTCYVLKCR